MNDIPDGGMLVGQDDNPSARLAVDLQRLRHCKAQTGEHFLARLFSVLGCHGFCGPLLTISHTSGSDTSVSS
jgi:hypothetical protein